MSSDALPRIERSALHLYQLYDLADSIDLERAGVAMASPSTRMRPVLTRGASIDMPQPPLVIGLDQVTLPLGGVSLQGRIAVRLYELGIVVVSLVLTLPDALSWEEATAIMADAQSNPPLAQRHFDRTLDSLRPAIRAALVRPNEVVLTEDYTILVIERLGDGVGASHLARHPTVLHTALGERRPLSAAASALATPFSYYDDDLILLTWTAAVVIEPDALAREDATFLLEFAHVQLLAFRTYDAETERYLARLIPRIAQRRRPHWRGLASTQHFLHEVHGLIADTTETSSRVENALKVTEDVYWNRVYTGALAILRVSVWRNGIAETLDVLRETAALLNDEVQATRATLLELLIIVLIAVELVVAVIGLHR